MIEKYRLTKIERDRESDLPITLRDAVGFLGYGAFGFYIEPIVKGLSDGQIIGINKSFLEKGIVFDGRFLHDQLTDFCFGAGAYFISKSLSKILISGISDHGKWGMSKENWEKFGPDASIIALLGGLTVFGEAIDGLKGIGIKSIGEMVTKAGQFSNYKLDERDIFMAFAAGMATAIATSYLWDRAEKKAVEIDLQA